MSNYYKVIWMENNDDYINFDTIGKRTTFTDWSAIYLQTTIDHALNYLEHKTYLHKKGYLFLVEFILKIDKIHILDDIFGKSDVSANDKSIYLKKFMTDNYKDYIGDEMYLMDSITKPILILDNPTEYELIVPHNLFNDTNFDYNILKKYIIMEKHLYNDLFIYDTKII